MKAFLKAAATSLPSWVLLSWATFAQTITGIPEITDAIPSIGSVVIRLDGIDARNSGTMQVTRRRHLGMRRSRGGSVCGNLWLGRGRM